MCSSHEPPLRRSSTSAAVSSATPRQISPVGFWSAVRCHMCPPASPDRTVVSPYEPLSPGGRGGEGAPSRGGRFSRGAGEGAGEGVGGGLLGGGKGGAAGGVPEKEGHHAAGAGGGCGCA